MTGHREVVGGVEGGVVRGGAAADGMPDLNSTSPEKYGPILRGLNENHSIFFRLAR